MKTPALVLYLLVLFCVMPNLAVKLSTVTAQVGEDFSHWPSLSAVAGVAESWALCALAIAFGVLLDNRGQVREGENSEDETRVVVKTPLSGDHKVTAKVVVTNNPRRANDDSSEFELPLD